ncbi:MAG: IS4 family transposase [Pirellulales bacterium]
MSSHLDWAEQHFSQCQLGDKRRTRRLVQVAAAMANNPSGSLPDQIVEWPDLKPAYVLLGRPEVTFDAIATPHWELVRKRTSGRYLILDDTTELDFGRHRDVEGLGPTGNGSGLGFLLHNGLMVNADTEELVGMAGQAIHYRERKPKGRKRENSSQIKKRRRESEVWGKVVNAIGKPAEGVQFIHVMDRGADNFEVYCHMLRQNCDWVVRASHLKRKIIPEGGQGTVQLDQHLPLLTLAGSYQLHLRARPQQPKRMAKLEVSIGSLEMPTPSQKSPWVRELKPRPIPMNVVHVTEVDAPAGVKPIRWTLFTSLPVSNLDDAWKVIEYYERRWLIEEYHKALKTGCQVEARQLHTKAGLEAITALLGIQAVRLLQLKSIARTAPDKPASQVVPQIWIRILQKARPKLARITDLTVRQFYREVAKLGGFLGRKGDGEPGWITLWRGWEKLNNYVHGASLALKLGPTV